MIKEFILKNTVFKNRLILLKRKIKLYKEFIDEDEIIKYQIEKFNLIWRDAQTNNEFYKYWAKKHNLPKQIKSIDELKLFPKLTKNDIQQNKELIFKDLNNFYTVSTGGSTGEPMKFPTSKAEKEIEYANTYLGKSWWNVNPLDDIVMFWGHSHLFGTGIKGKINHFKRIFQDWLINTKRFNAYDMTVDTLSTYYHRLKKLDPKVIIGYTSLNYKLAKYIKENDLSIGNKTNLKSVIFTSESV